jgi:hypothetical protein
MTCFNLFPYDNRNLGLKESKVDRELNMDTREQALIAIANFKNGQEVPLKGDLTSIFIDFISDGAITYTPKPGDGSKVTVNAEDVRESQLLRSVSLTLDSVYPDYEHPLCEIIESDPAIYRLRTQKGYVINDALCLMSGNVSYAKKVEASLENVSSVDDDNVDSMGIKTEKKELTQGQQYSLF